MIIAARKGLQFFNASGQTFISPELEGTENGVAVSFWYAVYSSAQTFKVAYSTSTSGFDWDNAESITANNISNTYLNPPVSNWLQYHKVFPAGTKQVAIKVTNNAYFFVDDIRFEVPVTIPKSITLVQTTGI